MAQLLQTLMSSVATLSANMGALNDRLIAVEQRPSAAVGPPLSSPSSFPTDHKADCSGDRLVRLIAVYAEMNPPTDLQRVTNTRQLGQRYRAMAEALNSEWGGSLTQEQVRDKWSRLQSSYRRVQQQAAQYTESEPLPATQEPCFVNMSDMFGRWHDQQATDSEQSLTPLTPSQRSQHRLSAKHLRRTTETSTSAAPSSASTSLSTTSPSSSSSQSSGSVSRERKVEMADGDACDADGSEASVAEDGEADGSGGGEREKRKPKTEDEERGERVKKRG